METLADRIKSKMDELGITQGVLAKKTGVSQPAIQKILSGETKEPKKIYQIAQALSTTVAWLKTGKTPEANETPPVIDYEDWVTISPKTRALIDDLIMQAKKHTINDDVVFALQATMNLITRSNHAHI